jgi:hypothetical protein
MNETIITVEIHCLQPRWVADENSFYRLYLNDDLLTERTWLWNQNTFIVENIIVSLSKNQPCIIRLEIIKNMPGALTKLALRNLIVNGIKQDDYGGEQDQLPFTLT